MSEQINQDACLFTTTPPPLLSCYLYIPSRENYILTHVYTAFIQPFTVNVHIIRVQLLLASRNAVGSRDLALGKSQTGTSLIFPMDRFTRPKLTLLSPGKSHYASVTYMCACI